MPASTPPTRVSVRNPRRRKRAVLAAALAIVGAGAFAAPAQAATSVLWSAKDSYTVAISGAGQVVLTARGDACDGPSIAEVSSESGVIGQATVPTDVAAPMVIGTPLPAGAHTLTVRLANDLYRPNECDRNIRITSLALQPVANVSQGRPGASNTGVPAGTKLTVHQGNLVVKTAGTVIDGLDIRGEVEIKANNVKIKRSIIRGGATATQDRALVMAWWNYTGATIEDSTLVATNRSLLLDGLSGSNFTATRVNVSNVVDPVKVIGSNVTVANSWLHGNVHSDSDPNQKDGRTHDDSIQITSGSAIVIRGNTLEDAHNAAIQINQGASATSAVTISGNWLSDGVCTLNISQGSGKPLQAIKVTGNRFGPGSEDRRCPILSPSTSPVQFASNVWDDTGAAAAARFF